MTAGSDATASRRRFLAGLAGAAGAGLGLGLVGCGSDTGGITDAEAGPAPDSAPLPDAAPPDGALPDVPLPDAAPAQRPTTTVRERIQGVLPHTKQPTSKRSLWGVTHAVAGEAHTHLDLLGAAATATAPAGAPASLLYTVQLTDVHVIDEESPARTINLDKLASPAWRAQEAHNTQVLDAMLRKVRALDAFRPVDCVLFTGDVIDNNQINELQWFLRVVEGGSVLPNSGSLEDPLAGAGNDPHDAFTAAGLGTIPWYAAMGNHDGLIQGNLPHGKLLGYSLVTGDPTRDSVASLSLGRVNTPTCNPLHKDAAQAPPRCMPTHPSKLGSGSLPADKDREHLTRKEWIKAVRAAKGMPAGHGLAASHESSGVADFVVDPVPGLPLRLVVLDTLSPIGAQGAYPRISSFLTPALKQAETDGVLVIVVSHHDSAGIVGFTGALRGALNACPNVLLHVVGHGHKNRVSAHKGSSAAHGYWEVQTSALCDWPQQARLIELVDRRDGTVELWLTLVDFGVDHKIGGPLAAASRFLAMREIHVGENKGGASAEGKVSDRNVVLRAAIPQAVSAKLAQLPGKPIESKLL